MLARCCVCVMKRYKKYAFHHCLVYFLPILVLGYKHDVVAGWKCEVGARSSAGEHLVDIEGVTGSIPVVPTTSIYFKKTLDPSASPFPRGPLLSGLNLGKDVRYTSILLIELHMVCYFEGLYKPLLQEFRVG